MNETIVEVPESQVVEEAHPIAADVIENPVQENTQTRESDPSVFKPNLEIIEQKRGRGRPRLSDEEKEKRKKERETLRGQGLVVAKSGAVTLQFPCDQDHVGNFNFAPEDQRRKDVHVWHVFPRLCDYNAALVSDRGVNPREHNESILHSQVAKAIRKTLRENPEEFHFHNRGVTILAESVNWSRKQLAITLADWHSHGAADGATTNYVIAQEQQDFLGDRKFEDVPEDEWPEFFKNSRVHLEIFVNLEDRETIAEFVEARNTSRQVKKFSISNFRGHFDWLKEVLENSEFKGKIGETENTDKPIDILDVISNITLFHPNLSENESFNPSVAYASRSRLDNMFVDEHLDSGYKALAPIVTDILKLRDEIYVTFNEAYEQANPDARLARRKGFDARVHTLPLTGREAQYKIPNAFIMVLLSAFRALVKIEDGKAVWVSSPFEFWHKHGSKLVKELLRQAKAVGNSQNMLGKSEIAYSALYREAKLINS